MKDEDIKFIESISNILNTHDIPVEFYKMVVNILRDFKYKLSNKDEFALAMSILRVKERVLSYCNINILPYNILPKVAVMACGDFMFLKKRLGVLEIGELDFSSGSNNITSLTEGDLKVSFDVSLSESSNFDKLLNSMINLESGEFDCYRRLKW